MRIDSHVHIMERGGDPQAFRRGLRRAGLDGAVLISIPPRGFFPAGPAVPDAERLDNLFQWTRSGPNLYAFYWIDPLARDADRQVARAVAKGVHGFKVICDRFFPHDPRALRVFRRIAEHDRPILFHSGILWDGKPSSRYNRPVEFEGLIEVPGLRFAVAHISWPWTDECLAVFGKFVNAHGRRDHLTVRMFIDVTPGTPTVYRREALARLFQVDYGVGPRLLFGSDATAGAFEPKWVREWIARDQRIYRALKVPPAVQAGIFGGNLERFITGRD